MLEWDVSGWLRHVVRFVSDKITLAAVTNQIVVNYHNKSFSWACLKLRCRFFWLGSSPPSSDSGMQALSTCVPPSLCMAAGLLCEGRRGAWNLPQRCSWPSQESHIISTFIALARNWVHGSHITAKKTRKCNLSGSPGGKLNGFVNMALSLLYL